MRIKKKIKIFKIFACIFKILFIENYTRLDGIDSIQGNHNINSNKLIFMSLFFKTIYQLMRLLNFAKIDFTKQKILPLIYLLCKFVWAWTNWEGAFSGSKMKYFIFRKQIEIFHFPEQIEIFHFPVETEIFYFPETN